MNPDAAAFRWLNAYAGHASGLDTLMTALARYAPIAIAAVLLASWARWTPDWQRAAALGGIAALAALAVGQLVGLAYPRPRPYLVMAATVLVPHAPDTSFPSDHAILVSAVSVVLATRSRKLGLALCVFSLLVLVARVYIGVHYPGDVIGGALLGAAGAWATLRLAGTRPGTRLLDAVFAFLARFRLAASSQAVSSPRAP